MSISKYQVKEETRYQIYINLRSNIDATIRFQKRIKGLKTFQEAKREEKKQTRIILEKIHNKEGLGVDWETVLKRYELYHCNKDNEDALKRSVLKDYMGMTRKWTKTWFKMAVSQISRADVKEVFRLMNEHDRSKTYQRKLKRVINQIFEWAQEERVVREDILSPMAKFKFGKVDEKIPEILNISDIRTLLREAKRIENPWYPIWATGLLTGMRSGELCALTWENIDLENNIIHVHRNYVVKDRDFGPTKGRYWRTLPISSELKEFFIQLKAETNDGFKCPRFPNEGLFVLPRFRAWYTGHQASEIQNFCKSVNLKPIKFHTLRACFATHLLNLGITQGIVMKICGWKELKTMERYIRLAGVEVQGMTEKLKVLPILDTSYDNVVNLMEFEATTH